MNVIDEFQFLSEFNMAYLTVKENWRKLILMSATPEVPLLDAATSAGVELHWVKKESLRKAKRFLVRGNLDTKV